MTKLETVFNRSISKDFNLDEMEMCKTMTDKLDVIRKEKFENIFPYFNSSDDFINNDKTYLG